MDKLAFLKASLEEVIPLLPEDVREERRLQFSAAIEREQQKTNASRLREAADEELAALRRQKALLAEMLERANKLSQK